MTKELAALLAQLIPVVALAAGLELRSLSKRYDAATQEVRRVSNMDPLIVNPAKASRASLIALIGAMVVAQCILAASEEYVLTVLLRETSPSMRSGLIMFVVVLAIAIVIVAPAYEVAAKICVDILSRRKRFREIHPLIIYTVTLMVFAVALGVTTDLLDP